MFRLLLLLLCVFALAGCWMFEKTDDRPAPIVEATQEAITAFQETASTIAPIPGLPTWLAGAIGGGAVAITAFISVLVTRAREQKKVIQNAVAKPQVVAKKSNA